MANMRITDEDYSAAEVIWNYHQLHHQLRPVSVGIGLGCHDLGVATLAAELYRAELLPLLVFSGANGPTTIQRFPRGEANHFRDHAVGLGVPESVILEEPAATNTGQNVIYSRQLLEQAGTVPASVVLICMPYMERRAYATCRKLWPEVEVLCASQPLTLHDYVQSFGDAKLIIDDLVGDLQRIVEYPRLGFAIEQDVPKDVVAAYEHLVRSGFRGRLMSPASRTESVDLGRKTG